MRRVARRTGRNRGFTLIESLVAVAVATTALAGFYSAMSTGLRLEQRSQEQASQVAVAATILDLVGPVYDITIGMSENGRLNGFDWTLTVTGRPADDMVLGNLDSRALAFVYVEVTDPDGGSAPVVLRGIRYVETPL